MVVGSLVGDRRLFAVKRFTLPKPDNIELDLAIAVKVLKLESLHYGLWEKGEELTFTNLKAAQRRYTEHLIEFIPPRVRNILDVGCGIGDNAVALSKRGYEVVCVSPDPLSGEYLGKVADDRISFHLSKFEDFVGESRFDLVLMSESSNYFGFEVGFRKCRELLRPDSHVLVSVILRREAKDQYLSAAREFGFEVSRQEDITERTIPTLEFGHRLYRDHVVPALDILGDYYRRTFSLKYRVGRLLFGKELSMLSQIVNNVVPERLDPENFRRNFEYLVLLFQG
jgi:MPBQ/MSBQ methyltransferase